MTGQTGSPHPNRPGRNPPPRPSLAELIEALGAVDVELLAMRHVIATTAGLRINDTHVITNLIRAGGHMRVADIGAQLDLSSGTVTGMIDRLERSGLVTRSQNGADRRSTIITATERCTDMVRTSRSYLEDAMEKTIDAATLSDLVANLNRLADRLADTHDEYVSFATVRYSRDL